MQSSNKFQTLKTPHIGDYWPGQGGVYAGMVRDGDRQWHLIMATGTEGAIKTEWGNYPNEIPGEFSRVDGQHNTQLVIGNEPHNKAVRHCVELVIDGHQDFYWPAEYENTLIAMNLPDHVGNGYHWSSTQYSARSAWVTYFGDGGQLIDFKYDSYAVRAVRRLPIE